MNFEKMSWLSLRVFLSKLQGNKFKCYASPNNKSLDCKIGLYSSQSVNACKLNSYIGYSLICVLRVRTSVTRRITFSLLSERQLRFNSKINIKEFLWKFWGSSFRKIRNNEEIFHKEKSSIPTVVGHTRLFYTLIAREFPIWFVRLWLSTRM